MDIFEKEIKGFTVDEEGQEVSVVKKIKEVLDTEKDITPLDNGNYVIRRQGVQKLADFVKATWGKPEIVDTPSNNNGRGFFVMIECKFPDGTSNFGPGESTEKNTNIGSSFLFMTAINRAKAVSFLRSPYIGMYEVYSEEELKQAEKTETVSSEEVAKLKEGQKRYAEMIKEMIPLVALPDEDEEYPKAYVIEVWDVHQDLEYLKKLTKHSSNVIKWVAKNKLKEVTEQQQKEEEEKTA